MDDDSAPVCACVTTGSPLGPFCLRSCALRFSIHTPARKHGGSPKCPRACGECNDGAHHFTDLQPLFNLEDELDDEEDREEQARLREHPAALAGCEMWYECKHCPAWMEASEEDDDADDDYEPDSMDFDEDDGNFGGDGCIVCGPENDCECDDGPPDSEDDDGS